MLNKIVISTGSNLGDRSNYLHEVRERLRKTLGGLMAESSLYESKSWGFDGNSFLNQVLIYETESSAQDCLKKLLALEVEFGRKRSGLEGYSDRPVDLDIIFYNSDIVDVEGLKIPHPKMEERNFVLLPLDEIMPEFKHPVLGKTISELVEISTDKIEAKIYQ